MLSARATSRVPFICRQCRERIAYQRRHLFRNAASYQRTASSENHTRAGRRAFHATRLNSQLETRLSVASADPFNINPSRTPIRAQLQEWQDQFGGPNEDELSAFENHPYRVDEVSNNLTKLQYRGIKSDEEGTQQEQLDATENDDEEPITIGLFLKPGDVVELSMPGCEPVLAVFVQQLALTSQFFSVNGRWCHAELRHISFAIPGCIDSALLEPMLPFMPTQLISSSTHTLHVPRHLSTPVTNILQALRDRSEKIYRDNAAVLDTAYNTLADKTRTRMLTLTQITKALIGRNDQAWNPDSATLLAVRKALLHHDFRFSSDLRSQRLTNIFSIRSKDEAQGVETVHDWIRQYLALQASRANGSSSASSMLLSNPTPGATYVTDFIEKARRLIAHSREQRDPMLGSVGPSKIRPSSSDPSIIVRTTWGDTFSDTDKQIINFMRSYVMAARSAVVGGFKSACAAILHATGYYTKSQLCHQDTALIKTGKSICYLFLQEIGVLSPYENALLYDEQLMLPTVRLSRNLELLMSKAELTRRSPDFRDSMADLRRDWGNTTVYCIDDAGAKEIDDGVSISRVDGSDNQFWVHVHVANPTAFFDKTHALSGLAAHMTESVYTPDRSFPMMPTWASQKYFSLGRNRPVLTFSARVDSSGAILEKTIQPGTIRRVVSLTPKEVSAHIGEEREETMLKLVVGGDVPLPNDDRAPTKLSQDQVQDLRDLYKITGALWHGRQSRGGVKLGGGRVECRVFDDPHKTGLTWSPPSLDRARYIHGDPIIEVTARRTVNSFVQSHTTVNIVEELMLLACQAAASWCGERHIPVIFRGTVETPANETGIPLEEFKETILEPHLANHNAISRLMAFQYVNVLGRAISHSSPLPHRIIGADSYLKVTSPLRRFGDMIAHWQIEAALRHEARTGKLFNAQETTSTTAAVLPFSQQQIQESVITLSPREKIISGTKLQSQHFWFTEAFMRAYYYKEAVLPDTFRVTIRHTLEDSDVPAMGVLNDYDVKVNVTKRSEAELRIGDEWETRVLSINCFTRTIEVKPIRLVHREE